MRKTCRQAFYPCRGTGRSGSVKVKKIIRGMQKINCHIKACGVGWTIPKNGNLQIYSFKNSIKPDNVLHKEENFEYIYNDKKWGIEQVIYSLDDVGNWVKVQKSEYKYDDRANIIDEMVYLWKDNGWVKAAHNCGYMG